jgi:hypothetical protein
MRFHRSLVPVLAVALLVGCGHTEKIELWATMVTDPQTGQKRVDIDESKHDSGVVRGGDRVAWVCHCPPGTEFTVEDLHLVADLEAFFDRLNETPALGAEEDLARAVEQMRVRLAAGVDTPRAEAAPGQQGEAAPKMLAGGRIRFEGPIGGVLLVVNDAQTSLAREAGEEVHSLFVEGLLPAPFVDATRAIRSSRVAPLERHELWKFTWRVQMKGDPSNFDIFDPHIFGHPDKEY